MPANDHHQQESPSHISLVAAVQSRDRGADDALATLVNAYLPLIRRHCRSVPYNLREDALSAGTEGFLRAVHRYDPSGGASLGTYASHFVRGAVLELLRQEAPWRDLVPIDHLEDLDGSNVHWMGAGSTGGQRPNPDLITIRDWVKRQRQSVRILLSMHFYDDIPQAEIARRIGVSRAAVSQRLSRIIRRAKFELGEVSPGRA